MSTESRDEVAEMAGLKEDRTLDWLETPHSTAPRRLVPDPIVLEGKSFPSNYRGPQAAIMTDELVLPWQSLRHSSQSMRTEPKEIDVVAFKKKKKKKKKGDKKK